MSQVFSVACRSSFSFILCSLPFLLGFISELYGQSAIPEQERQALIALYNSTDGPHWTYHTNWLGPAGTEGTWGGVKVENGHVVELSLPTLNLVGAVPPEIGNLTYLRNLNLAGIDLSGWFPGLPNRISSIPPEIGQLHQLKKLYLAGDGITVLPTEIGGLASLETLHIAYNQLTALPAAVGQLGQLKALHADNNQLETLPPETGSLLLLETLTLGRNKLTTLPPQIGNLQSLTDLELQDNPLQSLPPQLNNLLNLQTLILAPPDGTGLPSSLGHLKNLPHLIIGGGRVTELPEDIGEMTNLRILDAHSNQLSSLPPSFTGLQQLEDLRLGNNAFAQIPVAIMSLSSLVKLDLSGNPLAGPLPPQLGNLRKLKALYLVSKTLSGEIPPELGNMESLEGLTLSGEFTGTIPTELGRLSQLKSLSLKGQFTGSIPSSLADLSELTTLDIDGHLTGPFPKEATGLKKLVNLILSGNHLSGHLPPEIGQMTSLGSLDLAGNQFDGQLPPELGNTRLSSLNLSENRFSGEIPKQLGSLYVTQLDLSHNQLEGRIPPELAQSHGNDWSIWNLSANRLTGPIPPEFAKLESYMFRMDLKWNALIADHPDIFKLIGSRHLGEFEGTQSHSPFLLGVVGVSGNSVTLTWSPIPYSGDSGGYQILCSKTPGGPYTVAAMTPDKTANLFRVTGLETGTTYYFTARTVTYAHPDNENIVIGEPSTEVSATTSASAEVFFPLSPQTGQFRSFAVSNFGNTGMDVEFRARAASGALSPLPGNPASFKVTPRGQVAQLNSEIFKTGDAVNDWVGVSANQSLVTLAMIGGSGALDGISGLTDPQKTLYFPRIYQGASGFKGEGADTRLILANPSDSPARIRLTSKGESQASVEVAVAARGFLSASLPELFPTAPSGANYLLVDVVEGDGIVGCAQVTLGGGKGLFVSPGLPVSGSDRTYAAQVGCGSGLATSLRLINADTVSRKVQVRLIGDDGRVSVTPEQVLLPGQLKDDDLATLFNLPETSLKAGSLEVVADGSGVLGDILVYDRSTKYASSLPLTDRQLRSAVFGYVANGGNLYTGLALFNATAGSVEAAVEVLSSDGQSQGKTTIQLDSGRRIAKLLTELLPQTTGQNTGYVRLTSSKPVVAAEFFGDFSLEFLSVVPPVILE